MRATKPATAKARNVAPYASVAANLKMAKIPPPTMLPTRIEIADHRPIRSSPSLMP
jgi:hypothetical protein